MESKLTKLEAVVAWCHYIEVKERSLKDTARHFDIHPATLHRNFKKYGLATKPPHWVGRRRREKAPNWRGGRYEDSAGYVLFVMKPDDPYYAMSNQRGVIKEHRYVMAKHLGRILDPSETVHHIDGDKKNNDISNLQLRIGNHGKGQPYKCSDCGSDRIQPMEIAHG